MPSRSLTSAEAAARLGVKRESLYAYVSRGILARRTGEDGRSSVFDAGDVERLLGQRRRGRPPSTSIDLTITTAITRITDDAVWYRGMPLHDIAGRWSFEQTAEWLWTGAERPPSAPPWPAARGVRHASSTAASPGESGGGRRLDALIGLTVAAAASDHDRRPERAVAGGRRLIAAFADRVPPAVGAHVAKPVDRSIAARLAARLGGPRRSPVLASLVDLVLVILADHELASSTLAARVAASTRADAYGVVVAGLGVLAGPLHGGASREAMSFLADVGRSGSSRRTIDQWLRSGRRIPGFGHKIYRGVDPRFALLLRSLRSASLAGELPLATGVVDLVDAAVESVIERIGVQPNIDLGIAALASAAELAPDTGEVLFAVARTAGWIAHAIEEYGEAPVRFRPRSVYVGPVSGSGHTTA